MAFKSHDVRRMHPCAVCGGIGLHEPGDVKIPLVLRTSLDEWAHPRCLTDAQLFCSVAPGELSEIRRSDVEPHIYRAILEHLGRV